MLEGLLRKSPGSKFFDEWHLWTTIQIEPISNRKSTPNHTNTFRIAVRMPDAASVALSVNPGSGLFLLSSCIANFFGCREDA
jgi:hypothetical protein